jgi:hypothetical protein
MKSLPCSKYQKKLQKQFYELCGESNTGNNLIQNIFLVFGMTHDNNTACITNKEVDIRL